MFLLVLKSFLLFLTFANMYDQMYDLILLYNIAISTITNDQSRIMNLRANCATNGATGVIRQHQQHKKFASAQHTIYIFTIIYNYNRCFSASSCGFVIAEQYLDLHLMQNI